MLIFNIFQWFFAWNQIFLREPYISLLWAWWKKYVFDNFRAVFVIFDHANTCVCKRLLVEIHNTLLTPKRNQQIKLKDTDWHLNHFSLHLRKWFSSASILQPFCIFYTTNRFIACFNNKYDSTPIALLKKFIKFCINVQVKMPCFNHSLVFQKLFSYFRKFSLQLIYWYQFIW